MAAIRVAAPAAPVNHLIDEREAARRRRQSEADLINEREAARRLGVTVACLRRWRWLRSGVPWIRIGRAIRYQPTDLDQYIASRRVDPTGADAAREDGK